MTMIRERDALDAAVAVVERRAEDRVLWRQIRLELRRARADAILRALARWREIAR